MAKKVYIDFKDLTDKDIKISTEHVDIYRDDLVLGIPDYQWTQRFTNLMFLDGSAFSVFRTISEDSDFVYFLSTEDELKKKIEDLGIPYFVS